MSHRLGLIVPPHTTRWYGAGEHCTDPSDCDLILVDHGTDPARAIKGGQWLVAHMFQRELRGYTWLDHTAVVRTGVSPSLLVSEMGPRGHELRPLATYRNHLYAVIHIECDDVQRAVAGTYDRACWLAGYGWWQYPSFVVNGLTAAKFGGGWGDNLICSMHATMVAMAMGLFPAVPPEFVIPAHIACWFDASPPATLRRAA